jgi:aldehyde dehydrogenase (NAD+)
LVSIKVAKIIYLTFIHMKGFEENQRINETYLAQNTFFESGKTLDVNFRIEQLKKLRKMITEREELICEALAKDLGKPKIEAYLAEIYIVKNEIDFHIKHIKTWAKPKKVRGSLLNFPSQNMILQQPYGVSLIISPWNYPFQLLIMPLIGAISAGCTAILKPSELSPNVSEVIIDLISSAFGSNYIAVFEGDIEVSKQLLKLRFDKIFFTGSSSVGKIIMGEAAKHLTSVTLELGGKSPAIIDQDCDIYTSTKRIWWGKCLNAGQTCVATDYILVHERVYRDFLAVSKQVLDELFSEGIEIGKNYSKIINQHHFDRLKRLLIDAEIAINGEIKEDELLFGPTLVINTDWKHPLMKDEIFGPILPVLTFKDREDVINQLRIQPNPLALYVFSRNKNFADFIMQKVSFGGGCVNDTIGHLANHHLPFGGVGTSGMGDYHGYNSFTCFSHEKAILKKSFWPDLTLRYPPYGNRFQLIRRILN